MRTRLLLSLGLCLSSNIAQADRGELPDREAVGRVVDFSGGFMAGESLVGASDVGAELSARYHDERGFYVGGLFSTGLFVDDSKVEAVDVAVLVGGGLSLGLHAQVGALQFHSGARGEYMVVADDNGMRVPADRLLRAGPEMSTGLVLGRLWGHPMSLEARLSYLFYREGEGRFDGARAGLFLSGGLFPEP